MDEYHVGDKLISRVFFKSVGLRAGRATWSPPYKRSGPVSLYTTLYTTCQVPERNVAVRRCHVFREAMWFRVAHLVVVGGNSWDDLVSLPGQVGFSLFP